MAKTSHHPINRLLHKIISEDKLIHKPIVLLRGYIIEKSIQIERLLDLILIAYLFKFMNDDKMLDLIVDKPTIKYLKKIINENYGVLNQRQLELKFYQEKMVWIRISDKIEYVENVFNRLDVNESNLSTYNAVFPTLECFFNTRHSVAHWGWSKMHYNEHESFISYKKLGGEKEIFMNKDELDNFRGDFKLLRNALEVVLYGYFHGQDEKDIISE